MINTFDINKVPPCRSEDYVMRIDGDSMEPEFPDQCEVIIHPAGSVYNGAYVFAEVEGVRWLRKYVRDKRGEHLVALNSMIYPEITLEKLAWTILGVVVQRNFEGQTRQYSEPAINGLKVPMLLPR
ncbi:MAG: S24 family peptidase [Sedimenticola sp.]